MKRNLAAITWILGALTTITPFSIDMYLPAFSRIAEDFGTTVPRVGLSMSSYFVGLSLGQVFYGPFLDRYGRKRPLYFGLALYLAATALCIAATSVELLIGARFFQAIGGCAASVAMTAMVRDFYPAADRAKTFSKLMLILSVSPFFAPSIGSVLIGAFGWRSVFVALAGIVVLILVPVRFALPEGHAPDTAVSLRPAAIVAEFGKIFRHPAFFRHALAGAFSFASLFAYLAASPAIFMGSHGLTEKQFGLVFALLSVGMIGGGQFSILLGRRFSSAEIFRTAVKGQAFFAAIFLAATLTLTPGTVAEALLLFGVIACVGLTYPNAAALGLAPFSANAGSAAALMGFTQMGTGAVASAAFGFIPLRPSLALAFVMVATVGVSAGILVATRRNAKTPAAQATGV